MTSRQRLIETINHREPDRVVFDLGSSSCSAISAVALTKLREELGMKPKLVKCYNPFFGQAWMEEDDMQAFGVDAALVCSQYGPYGNKNDRWREWTVPCGTKVLVAQSFVCDRHEDGAYYIYPQGDRSVPPCAKIPEGGYFADSLDRQGEVDEDDLDARRDFAEDFKEYSDEDFAYMKARAEDLFFNTEYGINWGGYLCGLGDASRLPAPSLKVTPGVRRLEEWLMLHYTDPQYVKEVFEMQSAVALANLKRIWREVGDKIQVIQISGTDFGTQNSTFISREMFCEFYKPVYARLNDWVHENTTWKTMYHSCGSLVTLLDDFVEMGVDILNPVQCSAKGMDPKYLKENYGDKLTFWGGCVDTQKTLPFGTPEEVFHEVYERLCIFAPGGGYVCNPIHNVLGNTPPKNLIAMFQAIERYNNR